jgi:hypothetical protein
MSIAATILLVLSCTTGVEDTTGDDSRASDDSGVPTDADGDGYSPPEDCDDTNPDIHPGASEIGPDGGGDGVDSDCDGSVDEGAPERLTDASIAVLEGVVEDQYAGWDLAFVPDLDGDGASELVVGAPEVIGNFKKGRDEPGRIYIVGSPIVGTMSLDTAMATITTDNPNGDEFGATVGSPGDLDGDGRPELFASSSEEGGDAGDAVAYLFSPPINGDLGPEDADVVLTGFGKYTPWAFCALGSGSWAVARYTVEETKVLVLSGMPASGVATTMAEATLISGSGEGAGGTLAAGDVDGDGVADLAVGANHLVVGGKSLGGLYIVPGPFSDEAALADAGMTWLGDPADGTNANLSGTLLVPGDLDGDGRDDVVAAASGANGTAGERTGAVYLLRGEAKLTGTQSVEDAWIRIEGEAEGDGLGAGLGGVGDWTGDGFPELAISATVSAWPDSALAGRIYVLESPAADGTLTADALGARWLADGLDDLNYGSLAGGGDTDGDGNTELAVGAPYSDLGASDAGAVYLLEGP